MKVLHINANFISTMLHSLLVNKLNAYCDNVVYAPFKHSQLRIEYVSCPNVVESECTNNVDRLFFRHKSKKLYRNINNLIDVSEFDLIHAHTLFTDGYLAYKINRKYGKKYIVAVRNTDLNVFLKYMVHLRKLGIKILCNASKVIFLSESYKNRVFEKYIPRHLHNQLLSKTVIIPNGIDDFWLSNRCKNINIPDLNKVNVAFVGSLDKNKNVEKVIESLYILQKRGWHVHLDVAGRNSDDNILKKVMACGFAKYHGCVPKEKLIEIYRNNDIMILPSYNETFGLVYVEAMSQALPVIYTKNEGFDRWFKNGEVGFSVNPNSADEIVEAINSIFKEYMTISTKCIDAALSFDWSCIAKRYYDIYEDVSRYNAN